MISLNIIKFMTTKKQKNKVSEITIKDLAIMMTGGFKKQDDKIDTLFKKQDDKISSLALATEEGFKRQEKSTDDKISNLAAVMEAGFKRQEKITDEKIDDLAAMVKRGFDATSKEISGVRDDLSVVKEKVGNIEKFIFQQQNPRIQKVEKRLYNLEEVLMLNK